MDTMTLPPSVAPLKDSRCTYTSCKITPRPSETNLSTQRITTRNNHNTFMMKTISLKVPERLNRRIRAVARARGVSASELIRNVLEQGLPVADQETESAFDLMSDGFGIFSSGISDLATNSRHLDGLGD